MGSTMAGEYGALYPVAGAAATRMCMYLPG